MKTKQVLRSSDRNIFGVTIRQDTSQNLSVTDLQKAYEVARWQYGWTEKRVNDVLHNSSAQERVYYLLFETGKIKVGLSTFMEMVKNEGVTKVLKGLSVWKTTNRGSDRSVMCDPFIWMLLAMELNPMLYAKVVMWLTDTLIFDRVEAGNEFLPMNQAIKTCLSNPDYGKYATAINIKVFGQHKTGMRNLASAKELRRIADIEKFVTNAIQSGWISSEKAIIKAIEDYK